MQKKIIALPILAMFISSTVFAAGFEKVVEWSGKHSGMAGAGVSNSSGAEALFFNPAGLAGGKNGEISLNFSPTWAKYSGPIVAANTTVDSKTSFAPPGGALLSYKLTEQFGLGAGFFVAGGTKAIYEAVDFGTAFSNLKPDVKSDLSITEFSLGAGYSILPQLKIGAAWRISMVKADLASAQPAPFPLIGSTLVAVQLNDLSATRYNGFRVGAQWTDELWGFGANWRTAVPFTATGTSAAQVSNAALGANPVNATGSETTASNVFPSQVVLGGYFYTIPKVWRAIAEYAWTNYHVNKQLDVVGSATLPASLGSTNVLRPIVQNWQNQVNLRLATEYMLGLTALRAGYAYTSKVTPETNARATFSSPGNGNTITLGAGIPMGETIEVNVAGEYSFASGTVAADQPGRAADTLPGDYSTKAYVFHAGLNYSF